MCTAALLHPATHTLFAREATAAQMPSNWEQTGSLLSALCPETTEQRRAAFHFKLSGWAEGQEQPASTVLIHDSAPGGNPNNRGMPQVKCADCSSATSQLDGQA